MVLSLGAGHAAQAAMYHTGQFDGWSTMAGTPDNGAHPEAGMCSATLAGADRAFTIKADSANPGVFMQIFKRGWAIPDGQNVQVVMQVDHATPFSFNARGVTIGGINAIEIDVAPTDVWSATGKPAALEIVNLLASGLQVSFAFPEGNEQPWAGSLTGSTAALTKWVDCITAMKSAAATQPFAAPATQPFAATPAPIISANGKDL